MVDNKIGVDDLRGKSFVLTKTQREWLEGTYDGDRADRKFTSDIRPRYEDALRELAFIEERMSDEELNKVGKGQLRANTSVSENQPTNGFANLFEKSASGMVKTVGLQLEPLMSGFKKAKGEPIHVVTAEVLKSVWTETDQPMEHLPAVWADFANKVSEELKR